MNTSGEVADLMVKEGLMITEEALKLTGLGVKNLAAIVVALVNENEKTQGKTIMKNLLKSGEPVCIMQIKEEDLKRFNKEANQYGVLYVPVGDKTNNTGLCDIIAKQKDVTQLNYIMERMGYTEPLPEIEPEPEKDAPDKANPEKPPEEHSKNPPPRRRENPHEKESTKCGDMEREDNTTKKPSVRQKVEDIKEQQNKQRAEKAHEKEKQPPQHQKSKGKKKGGKKKGRNR